MFTLFFLSGDYRRVLTREIESRDIDTAAREGVLMVEAGAFGAGASWFLAGVVQTTALSEVGACIEADDFPTAADVMAREG